MHLEEYAHHAAWALNSLGEPSELISLPCYPLVPYKDGSPSTFVVPCRTPIEERCPTCGGALAWLFDFSGLPAQFFSGERAAAPRRILFCRACACDSPIFSRYKPDGTSEWHPANYGGGAATEVTRLPQLRELVATPRPPFAAAQIFGLGDATSLGGIPMWLQDAAYPRCPDCQAVMSFLAQFDNSSMPEAEEGIYYTLFCDQCRVAAVGYQQT